VRRESKRDVQNQRSVRNVSTGTSVEASPPLAARTVSLVIGGQRITVRTDKDEPYLQLLADDVESLLQQLSSRSRSVTTPQLLALAALHLADELHRARSDVDGVKTEVQLRAERLLRLLDSDDTDSDI